MDRNAKQKLILALDVPDFDTARGLVDTLGDTVEIYKVGYQLFVAYGPFVIRYLQAQNKKVFLDLKFHDIPNTVSNALAAAVGLSVPPHETLAADGKRPGSFAPLFMLTVHTQGGAEMLKAAAEAAGKRAAELKVPKPLVVGVTVLTSDAATDDTARIVLERARLARDAGLDGVVASVKETAMLRREMGKDFVIVTPGIRPSEGKGADAGDQKRVDTPAGAVQSGSSFLVVGRPIVKAADPKVAAEKILDEIGGVL